jgi:hypothetical protein
MDCRDKQRCSSYDASPAPKDAPQTGKPLRSCTRDIRRKGALSSLSWPVSVRGQAVTPERISHRSTRSRLRLPSGGRWRRHLDG